MSDYIAYSQRLGGTPLPPSDAYVRSFLYLLYTLIKLYYTKALTDPALFLAQIVFVSSGGQESRRLIVQQQPLKVLGPNGMILLFCICKAFLQVQKI